MKFLEDHSCRLIAKKEIAVEKYENNGETGWYWRTGKELHEIKYCPYCGKRLEKRK